jgi:hypothetical protein
LPEPASLANILLRPGRPALRSRPCPAPAPDRREGPADSRPPSGRPILPVPASREVAHEPASPGRLITGHRLGCAALTYLAEPGHQLLGPLLRVLDPADVLASITSGGIPADAAGILGDAQAARLRPALDQLAAAAAPHRRRRRAPNWPGTQPATSAWSAPATPNGRPGWMTYDSPATHANDQGAEQRRSQ